MSVRTESHVPTEEGGVNVDDEAPPPLVVDGVIDTNTTNITNENTITVEGDVDIVPPRPSTQDESIIGSPPEVEDLNNVEFSLTKLKSLDEQLGRQKWVVPVRARDELEMLIRGAINLARNNKDNEVEECQRFYKEGLTTSFIRILTDDAVNTWKPDIQLDIFNNSLLLVELCCEKIMDDNIHLLDILAIVLNPSCKWHVYNSQEPPSKSIPDNEGDDDLSDTVFARPKDSSKHNIKGHLIDLINRFGQNGGFQRLYDRICGDDQQLNVQTLAYLLRPFGYCYEYLTDSVYTKYIIPIVDKTTTFLDGLKDDLLKKEAATDTRSETFSSIMKSLRHLCHRIPGRDDIETFRLKMILRLLQISSFSGKMNALNEINKIIPTSVSYHPHFRSSTDEEQLSVARIGDWIRNNEVLPIVFRDNLHQPQYVEKLDRLVRFCIKEKVLTLGDLDMIWSCQDGKHEVIVKNIHDLLVKLAWDFAPEQLEYLFGCFQRSWVGATKKQRDELLDFIRHLAEDDKEGIMAGKVLDLLWTLARRDDCPSDTMEHALNAHIKILDYSCSQERESQKLTWLRKCVDEVIEGKWVIPALKQMREICLLYVESPVNCATNRHPSSKFYYRNEIIHHLDSNHHLLSHICESVHKYMEELRNLVKSNTEIDPELFCIDDKFNHYQQIQIRLDFVRFALKDGQLWLGLDQAMSVWDGLAQNSVFPSDRDMCFKWFAKLATWDEPDIDAETAQSIFTNKILSLDPSALTDNGFRCFDRFFRMVNLHQQGLSKWNRSCFITERVDNLLGRDYLWECILQSSDEIVHKPIELMKDIFTNLSSKLPQDQIHQRFIAECIERMKLIFDGLNQYKPGEIANETKEIQAGFNSDVTKLVRCLRLLIEYIVECDDEHMEERGIPPHGKAYWGKPLLLTVRYYSTHSHQPDDFEVCTHSNETVAALRRQIVRKLNIPSSSKLELSVGNDVLRKSENHRYVMTASVPLRDKAMIQARLQQFSNVSENSLQSSDNSTDSSEGSGHYDGPNIEAERGLPSVLIATNEPYMNFFLSLCDFAVLGSLIALRDNVRNLLKLLPTSLQLLNNTLEFCKKTAEESDQKPFSLLKSYVISDSPARSLYLLELIHSMLMPAVEMREAESNQFQLSFIKSGGIQLIFEVLTDPNFLANGDNNLKRAAYASSLKVLKMLLLTQAYGFILSVSQEISINPKVINGERHLSACQVQEAIKSLISNSDQRLKSSSTLIAKALTVKVSAPQPDVKLVQCLMNISWSSAVGDLSLANNPSAIGEKLSKPYTVESDDTHLARESIEVMTFAMAVSPKVLDELYTLEQWRPFLTDVVLRVKNRLVRVSAQDHLFHSITRCCTKSTDVLLDTVGFLFRALENIVKEYPSTSNEFFRLLARLLNHSMIHNVKLEGVRQLLDRELEWLEEIRSNCLSTQSLCVESQLLEGHLTLIVELIAFCSIEDRYSLGSKPDGMNLIPKLLNDFLFPASRVFKQLKKNPDTNYSNQLTTGICSSTDCVMAAYKLINALSVGCSENIETLNKIIMELFYSDDDPPLIEWEFFPHVGPRPSKGFVGLKNAGATCYMNSVLQQVYLISPVCSGVLSIPEAAEDLIKQEAEESSRKAVTNKDKKSTQIIEDQAPPVLPSDERKDTNRKVFRQLQCIFGHLREGKVQFHTPKGFWRDFRLEGQKVNLREQHDAFEFFNTLVDIVDEGLKLYGATPVLSKTLGGSFADQKICKGCPHRYSREEPFTAINVDIRLHHNLFESLDSYVKGDLLEGANAYHCEKCSKKVDTVKRMCINKLPQVLVIQLKRFDYDWEREMAVKFNDYFEFPREFDLAPYTAAGLARKEGEEIPDTDEKKKETSEEEMKKEQEKEKNFTTKYRLRGIVVHSGQASGGHYYSFAHVRPPGSDAKKWYKFDDGEVSEAKMEDDEELKSQCFGGEYTGEVYDHVLKKTHQRRQKRWWSAYLLFYDRVCADGTVMQNQPVTNSESNTSVPLPILKQVQSQNLEYLHTRAHFNYAYFQFMKQLLILNFNFAKQQIDSASTQDPMDRFERIGLQCMQLVTKFLFHTGFHTKKTLRGSANDWFDALYPYLHYSANIRRWFCVNVFLNHKNRLCEYLLESPSAELRNMFAKLVPYLCHVTNKDEGFEVKTQTNTGINVSIHAFSDIVFTQILLLLKKEVADHSRHLQQYFQVFLAYCLKGAAERQQLLKLGVPAQFIAVALDEGPGPALRSPYADLTRLYSVVGQLVRCCDVSRLQRSYKEGDDPLPNPYADNELSVKLPNDLQHWLFDRASSQHGMTYIKKIIEDNTPIDELIRFLGFCSWENWEFSLLVIADVLVEIATVQPFDMRPYLDLLLHLLMMNDSWQFQRIRAMFLGIQDRAEGLIVLMQHGQTHVVHQKRAYLCIKFIVNLCNRVQLAQAILDNDNHLKQSWQYSLQWLQNELERRQYNTGSYPYTGWSPPAQSNEVSNSYFLERSNSAKMTLTRARELFPMEEAEVSDRSFNTGEDINQSSGNNDVTNYDKRGGANDDKQEEQIEEQVEVFHNLDNIDNDDVIANNANNSTNNTINSSSQQFEVNETAPDLD